MPVLLDRAWYCNEIIQYKLLGGECSDKTIYAERTALEKIFNH